MIKTVYYMEVPFYDVDSMGIVWHGNYIKYLEQARCDMLTKIGYTYMDMYNDGVMYPIAKMEFKFIKPSKFGDKLRIETELKDTEPALSIKYTIYNDSTDEKVFKAKSTMHLLLIHLVIILPLSIPGNYNTVCYLRLGANQ